MPKQQFAPTRFQLVLACLALVAALVLGVFAYFSTSSTPTGSGTGTALVGGPFALTDQTGKHVTEKDYLGKYTLVFFGYTYCPDVCPTELQVISAALDKMGAKADIIQPIFVTIDPERDTPEVIRQYVANFHPRLVGLTGSPQEIAAAAKAYRVYFSKVDNKASPGDYLMDHSSIVYLMDKQGRFLKHFTYTTDAVELAQALETAIEP